METEHSKVEIQSWAGTAELDANIRSPRQWRKGQRRRDRRGWKSHRVELHGKLRRQGQSGFRDGSTKWGRYPCPEAYQPEHDRKYFQESRESNSNGASRSLQGWEGHDDHGQGDRCERPANEQGAGPGQAVSKGTFHNSDVTRLDKDQINYDVIVEPVFLYAAREREAPRRSWSIMILSIWRMLSLSAPVRLARCCMARSSFGGVADLLRVVFFIESETFNSAVGKAAALSWDSA